MHLLVDIAEIDFVFGRLPALTLLASVYITLLCFVLPEIKSLLREHFGSNGLLELLVRQLAVFVEVELVENFVELLLSYCDAPELQVVLEFISRYLACLAHIHVLKCFPDGFPLKFDFFNDFFFDICPKKYLRDFLAISIF